MNNTKTDTTALTPAFNFRELLIRETAETLKEFSPSLEGGETSLTKYEHLRITDKTQIPPPIPRVLINGEIICTECNITTISGASKSGKSAFTSIILAGAISSTSNIDGLDGLEVATNPQGKAVIHFDTEQARHKHQGNLKSTLKRAFLKECPDFYQSFNIRELEVSQYETVTSEICQAAKEKFNGVHLIVVDGIADYIKDVNDTLTANAIVKFFEDTAILCECPVIVIVHTNPGSDKERGHLGSQCQRKSESVISVKTEGNVSFIEPKFLRMAGLGNVPQLQFSYCKEKGYHVGAGTKIPADVLRKSQRLLNQKAYCEQLFQSEQAYKYGDLLKSLEEITGKSTRTVKDILPEMIENGLIIKDGNGLYRNMVQ